MKMTVIPTKYAGVVFRSRLEARFAVFFDALGIKWEYEKEGFKMEDGKQYLPDFYLPDVYLRNFESPGVFFEVKPSVEKMLEKENIFNQFDAPLVIACGQPTIDHWSEWLYEYHTKVQDNYMFFKYCEDCHTYEIEFAEQNYCYCRKCKARVEEPRNWTNAVTKMKSFNFT